MVKIVWVDGNGRRGGFGGVRGDAVMELWWGATIYLGWIASVNAKPSSLDSEAAPPLPLPVKGKYSRGLGAGVVDWLQEGLDGCVMGGVMGGGQVMDS